MNRFVALIIAHVAAAIGLTLAFRCYDDSALVAASFFGLWFGQTALLAIWGGFSGASVQRRVVGLCAAALGMWVLVITAIDDWRGPSNDDRIAFAVLIAACLTSTAGAFLALKRWGPRLRISLASGLSATSKPLQFSMRHIFMLAFAVSAALTLGRCVRMIQHGHLGWWIEVGIVCVVLAVCLLHVVLAAVWACLGADKVALRVLVALVAAAFFSLFPAYSFEANTLSDYVYTAVCAGIGQTVTLASLAVVRLAGYRVEATRPTVDRRTADFVAMGSHPLD